MPSRNDYISDNIRQLVAQRAENRCEYCLIHEDDTYIGCEIDHIIRIKHKGLNHENNLAFACLTCNRFKGSDIASLTETGELAPFFNPRKDIWSEHFKILGSIIIGITNIGKVTVNILKFNEEARIEERLSLQEMGLFPF